MPIDRRKRPLKRVMGQLRDATLFIVATEGRRTEPIYFGIFMSPRIRVETLGCEDGHSSPEGVLDRVTDFQRKYQFGAGDTFWLVLDRDDWKIKTLTHVFTECRKKDVSLLISNPMFEIWLALHFDDALPENLSKKSLSAHLRRLLGSYSKSNYPADSLLERSEKACERAKNNDSGTNPIWPDSPGTRVYKLVAEILNCL